MHKTAFGPSCPNLAQKKPETYTVVAATPHWARSLNSEYSKPLREHSPLLRHLITEPAHLCYYGLRELGNVSVEGAAKRSPMCAKPAQEYPWRRPKSQPQEMVSVGYREEASNYSALSIGYDCKGTTYVLWRRTESPASVIDRIVKDAEGFLYTCQFECDDARCADSTFLALIRGET